MTLESLARTIAKARHGTDVMWPNYMEAAKAAAEWSAKIADGYQSSDGDGAGHWAAREVARRLRAPIREYRLARKLRALAGRDRRDQSA